MNILKLKIKSNPILVSIALVFCYCIIVFSLIIALNAVFAKKATASESCDKISTLAKVIMKGRQDGILLADVINSANGFKLSKIIAIEAYKEPLFSTVEHQKSAI